MKREPCDHGRLRLFSKAPLAEVLKEEGEEPLGKDRLGLPFVAAHGGSRCECVHRLYLS
jgi:hypothetical protein